MLLKAIGLIATIAGGVGLANSISSVRPGMAILTALLAAITQVTLRRVLPHDAIEQIAQSNLYTASGQIVLMALALVEMVGLLVPVALTPWAQMSSRAWAALYVLGSAFLAGATYYFPFDVEGFNGEGPTHPSYELVLVFALPFGAIGFLVGWLHPRQRARLPPGPPTTQPFGSGSSR